MRWIFEKKFWAHPIDYNFGDFCIIMLLTTTLLHVLCVFPESTIILPNSLFHFQIELQGKFPMQTHQQTTSLHCQHNGSWTSLAMSLLRSILFNSMHMSIRTQYIFLILVTIQHLCTPQNLPSHCSIFVPTFHMFLTRL